MENEKNASTKILYRAAIDPLEGLTREEVTTKFHAALRGRVQEAYFFGSFAKNSMDRWSDVDLILVTNTDEPFPDRGKHFLDLYKIVSGLDLLVYTPEEFASCRANPSSFWRGISTDMQRFI